MPNRQPLTGVIDRFNYRDRLGVVQIGNDPKNLVWLHAADLPMTIYGRLATRSLRGTRLGSFQIEDREGSLCAVDITADVHEPRVGKPVPPCGFGQTYSCVPSLNYFVAWETQSKKGVVRQAYADRTQSGVAGMIGGLFPHSRPRPVFCLDKSSQTGFAFVPKLLRRKISRAVWREAAECAGVTWIEVVVCKTVEIFATAVMDGELVLAKSKTLVCPWGVARSQTEWVKVDNFKEVPTAVMPPSVRGLLIHTKTLRPAAQPRSSTQAKAQFLLALANLDEVGRVVYTNEDMIRNVTFPSAPKADDLDSALAQANQSATASA